MTTADDPGRRTVPWPPPSPNRPEEWQQQQAQHYGQPYGQQPQQRLKLTPEEVAVLQSCSRESFWYRCVPLAVGAVIATQTLVNRGIWQPNPRYGSLFKNMAAALVAYLVGKVSYQGECRRKIMMLENSPLAEAMRRGKRGRELFQEMSILPPTGGSDVVGDQRTLYSDRSVPGSHLDIDTDSRKVTELDESLRPTLDDARMRSDDKDQQYKSYADLRAQNRMEYERKMMGQGELGQGVQGTRLPAADRPLPPPPSSSDMYSGYGSALDPPRSPAPRVNKYGDVIET